MNRAGVLFTADGASFAGTMVGAAGISTGEVVFNTSMSGYQEVFSDPSYAGQVVVMTSPHIGNYGTTGADQQAERPWLAGVVVRSMSRIASSWRSQETLAEYLAAHGIVAIADVDTRRLTRHIRDRGAMPVAMGPAADAEEVEAEAASAPTMDGMDFATRVSTTKPYRVHPEGNRRGRVVVVDLGVKRDIIRQLVARGFVVDVVPATTAAVEIRRNDPDCVVLSNGPGDPAPLIDVIASVGDLVGTVPLFGICLGHQVLGLALGGSTFKLPFGHHGANHPVRDIDSGRVHITAQNHGFAVEFGTHGNGHPQNGVEGEPSHHRKADPGLHESKFGAVAPTHQNLNDGTLEGFRCLDVKAAGVQFHPEAAPGPHDALHLLDWVLEAG